LNACKAISKHQALGLANQACFDLGMMFGRPFSTMTRLNAGPLDRLEGPPLTRFDPDFEPFRTCACDAREISESWEG
jgi:hypothetical protein